MGRKVRKNVAAELNAEQRDQAEALAQRMGELVREDLLALAQLLVSKPTRELFGDTEFQVRDIVLRIGAKAYEEHLAQKKTAMSAAASPVPNAGNPPNSRTTIRKSR